MGCSPSALPSRSPRFRAGCLAACRASPGGQKLFIPQQHPFLHHLVTLYRAPCVVAIGETSAGTVTKVSSHVPDSSRATGQKTQQECIRWYAPGVAIHTRARESRDLYAVLNPTHVSTSKLSSHASHTTCASVHMPPEMKQTKKGTTSKRKSHELYKPKGDILLQRCVSKPLLFVYIYVKQTHATQIYAYAHGLDDARFRKVVIIVEV